MATKTAQELRERIDAAWKNLSGQIKGMDAHLERADAAGEWTARQVLSHLLFDPGFDPAKLLGLPLERPRGPAREDPRGGRPGQRSRRQIERLAAPASPCPESVAR